jgi:hypothetical protein
MAISLGGLLQDPDSLSYELATYTATTTKELVLDTTNKIIKITRVGNLTADGVTLKCLYSKLKELWKSDATLIKFPFAMTPITDEQFEFTNGWRLDTTVNPTTKITHAGTNSGTSGTKVITTTGNFNTSNIVPGLYISGTGVGTNAKVVSVDSNTQITVDVNNSGTVSGSLTFWGDVDYTYNLIRTGGWALKSTAGVTQEEWICAISLGELGAEKTTKTLTLTSASTASSTITVASTAGLVAGSFVTGASIPLGTTISSITNGTQFVISKTITLASGAIVTVRPKDKVYYQIGTTTSTPIACALTGQVNQAIKTYGDASNGNFDYRGAGSTLRFFVREQGWTYGKQSKADIGVTTTTYQAYRFPVSNASDALKITHADSAIDTSNAANGLANQSPYSNMSITWYAAPQARTIGGSSRNFSVIIDADTTVASTASGAATAEQVYEFVQWSLRRGTGIDIDQGASAKVGAITRDLLTFVGDTLYTIYDATDGGVYIDSFNSTDTNRLVFADDTNTNRTFPYTAAGTLSFNTNLQTDGANAVYRLFYKQINPSTSSAFGTANAVLVNKADNTTPVSGTVTGASVGFDFDYDGNTQCAWAASRTYAIGDFYRNGTTWYKVNTGYTSGGTFGATDTTNSSVVSGPDVILVAIGLSNSQHVLSEGVIARSISNSISAVASLERSYSNPA